MGRAQLTACLSYVAVNVSNCYSLVTKLTRKKSAMLWKGACWDHFLLLTMLFPFTGSMYDGLADGYGYGTSRGSYYAKTQTGNSSWGYPVRYSFIWEPWRTLEVTCAESTLYPEQSCSKVIALQKLAQERLCMAMATLESNSMQWKRMIEDPISMLYVVGDFSVDKI